MTPDDVVTCRHMVRALEQYRLRLELSDVSPPSAMLFLERVMRFGVTGVQGGSSSAGSSRVADSGSVDARLLSYDTAAEYLEVSESTVKRLVRSGRLPVLHVGAAPRVRMSDLVAYIDSLSAPVPSVEDAHETRRSDHRPLQEVGGHTEAV